MRVGVVAEEIGGAEARMVSGGGVGAGGEQELGTPDVADGGGPVEQRVAAAVGRRDIRPNAVFEHRADRLDAPEAEGEDEPVTESLTLNRKLRRSTRPATEGG